MRIPRSAIALFCTALQICFGTVYAWSFFQTILVRQIGWTHTETAWAFSIAIFTLGVSAAWAGNMLPKMGPRKLALIGSFMFACGYLVSGLALEMEYIPLFYLGYGVIGGAGIGLGYVTPVATVAKWFPDRKGLATGIVVMGFGVGAFLLSKGLAPFLIVRTAGALPEVFIWLGIIFALILIPCSLALSDPPPDATGPSTTAAADPDEADEPKYARTYLGTTQFVFMWIVFFFNIAAGISVVSFQSEILQEIWGLADDSIEPTVLAEYGATLIAVSSICNGLGRLFWGLLSDRFGRVTIFRVLLGSQMVVFGILMTETNPGSSPPWSATCCCASAAASPPCLPSSSTCSARRRCPPSTARCSPRGRPRGSSGRCTWGTSRTSIPTARSCTASSSGSSCSALATCSPTC